MKGRPFSDILVTDITLSQEGGNTLQKTEKDEIEDEEQYRKSRRRRENRRGEEGWDRLDAKSMERECGFGKNQSD